MTFAVRGYLQATALSLLALSAATNAEERSNPLRPAGQQSPSASPQTVPASSSAIPEIVEQTSSEPAAREAELFSPINAASHREQLRQVSRRAPTRFVYGTPDAISDEIMIGEPGVFISSEDATADIEGEVIAEGQVVLDHGSALCDDCGTIGCYQCCLLPCPAVPWHRLEFFSGATAFTGSANRGQDGSFGFHQGINLGAPLTRLGHGELGMQVGVRFSQSNLSGSAFTDDTRNQTFLTAGLFHRVDWGLQGGIVFDYMTENWNYGIDLSQLRGEVSWMCATQQDLGFQFMTNLKTDISDATLTGQTDPLTENWESLDLYTFFYRTSMGDSGTSGTIRAGWTGLNTALLATELQVPVTDNLAFRAHYTYLIPEEAAGLNGSADEVWNVGIGIVWYPGSGRTRSRNYYQPLFRVADNGSLITHRQ